MHGLILSSIVLLNGGIIIFASGLIVSYITDPISEWASILTVIGLLFLLGAIIMLCIAVDLPTSQ